MTTPDDPNGQHSLSTRGDPGAGSGASWAARWSAAGGQCRVRHRAHTAHGITPQSGRPVSVGRRNGLVAMVQASKNRHQPGHWAPPPRTFGTVDWCRPGYGRGYTPWPGLLRKRGLRGLPPGRTEAQDTRRRRIPRAAVPRSELDVCGPVARPRRWPGMREARAPDDPERCAHQPPPPLTPLAFPLQSRLRWAR